MIRIHAGRDLEEITVNDRTHHVGRNHGETIEGLYRLSVGQNASVEVHGDELENVHGSAQRVVDRNMSVAIGGTTKQHHLGDAFQMFDRAMTTTISGMASVNASSGYMLRVGNIGADEATCAVDVHGDLIQSASGTLQLRAERMIELAVGDTVLRLTPEGALIHAKEAKIIGESIEGVSHDGTRVSIGKGFEVASDSVKLYAKGASVELTENAAMDGKKILLNCGPGGPQAAKDAEDKVETKPLRLVLSNEDFEPHADKQWELVAEGRRYRGKTKSDGSIEQSIVASARFAELTLWPGEYPKGERHRWVIELTKGAPALTSIRGVLLALKNLGYYNGRLGDELDAEGRGALTEFQRDHGLAATGEVNEETVAKLGLRTKKSGPLGPE
jgi:type VI secretion system secreted protein VgrG